MILQIADVVRKVRDLPPLPAVVMELLGSLENADASVRDLAEKVSHDQAMTAKTLRLANSSFYGLQSKVATIQQAIAVLGFDSVRTLVTAAGVTGAFSSTSHGAGKFDPHRFWRHSIATALCAKALAQRTRVNPDYAFIAGLLHDIGALVLATRYPVEYGQALAYRAEHDCYMAQAEKAVLGMEHTMVGQALATYWKFPEVMQQAVANYRMPVTPGAADMATIVHVSDVIAHALDLAGDPQAAVPLLSTAAWQSLPLAPAAMTEVLSETERAFEDTCQALAA